MAIKKPKMVWTETSRSQGGAWVGPAVVDGEHDGNCMSETEAQAWAEELGASFKAVRKPSPRKRRKLIDEITFDKIYPHVDTLNTVDVVPEEDAKHIVRLTLIRVRKAIRAFKP